MSLIEIDINPEVFIPAYRHLLHSDADIDILWGGRDSGKSHFLGQKAVVDCLGSEYFKMLLIKKTYNSIAESQFQTIKEIIEGWGLAEYFIFKKNPLEIICTLNGNSFIARGCDDPQKIKSVRNPSHAWYEEADQLSEEDYITASTSLRSDRGRVKEYMSFNPEADGNYKDHWIFKKFFKSEVSRMYSTFSQTTEIKIPGSSEKVTIKYTSTHTTYHDNPFCTGERRAKLEALKDSNPYYYQVYALGKWGIREVLSPFLFNFKHAQHVGKTEWNSNQMTYLSFDFNKNPICCSVWQYYDDHIYGIEVIKLAHSDIDQLCTVIESRYSDALFIVVGDSTGYNNTALVKDDWNFYTAIEKNLKLETNQFQVIANPRIVENQVFMNKAFKYLNITLDEENCSQLIFDCFFAEMKAEGKLRELNKDSRNDPTQQLDALDTMRYFFNTIVAPEVNL